MLSFSINTNSPVAKRRIRKFRFAVQNQIQRPLRKAITIGQEEFRRQFSSRGARFGTPWAPLSEYTKSRRRSLGFRAGPPMVRTGILRSSIIRKGAMGNVIFVSPTEAWLASVWRPGARGGLGGALKTMDLVDLHTLKFVPRRPIYLTNGVGIGQQGVKAIEEMWKQWLKSVSNALQVDLDTLPPPVTI